MTELKKLRELAEKSIESKPTGTGSEWRIHYDYEKATNPETVIALIDELEAARKLAQYYAVHWDNCPKQKALDVECTCGVEALLEKVTHE